ncbi:hypothetical protein KQX54_021054 [Cotesia glomerata]|uniref:Uncharacterized protein n=1 Tax=Cotesia glomerata TaxID=32391 RepID=A0AAV7I5M8_COTGL|nr:hypothetical protein KQX54_021054 [Cotesia glomerata]
MPIGGAYIAVPSAVRCKVTSRSGCGPPRSRLKLRQPDSLFCQTGLVGLVVYKDTLDITVYLRAANGCEDDFRDRIKKIEIERRGNSTPILNTHSSRGESESRGFIHDRAGSRLHDRKFGLSTHWRDGRAFCSAPLAKVSNRACSGLPTEKNRNRKKRITSSVSRFENNR